MSLHQESLQRKTLELRLSNLEKEFEAFKKYKVDRHMSYNCCRGTHDSCKGRSCRCECHRLSYELFIGDIPNGKVWYKRTSKKLPVRVNIV